MTHLHATLRRTALLLLASMIMSLALFTLPAYAQPADSLILKGKALIEQGTNTGDVGDLRRARAIIERTLDATDRPALSHYYIGLADYRLVSLLSSQDEDQASRFMDDGIEHLERAVEADPDFAEAHALLAALYGWKAGNNPLKAIYYGPKSDNTMERAQELAPNNPRVVLLKATGTYNKPSMFGGDKEKALENFERAARLFEQASPSDPLMPDWGHADAHAWTGIAHMQADRPDEARRAFDEALAASPNYGWVKNVLMPQLADGTAAQ